ncbi:uncharacterized protein LOC141665704 [Apium graveolens]|uniref:uncharacterized protein LOC141665704 n=1 Tax=Apium graveolens TaxID=4045 RepID=UPI003D7B9F7B
MSWFLRRGTQYSVEGVRSPILLCMVVRASDIEMQYGCKGSANGRSVEKALLTLQQQQPVAPPALTFKNFQSVNPPEFKGSIDPVKANAWLKEIENAFDLVGVGIEQKTKFSSYFLKGEANYWWESKRELQRDEFVTWERFIELFLQKYFPRHMKNQMKIKFLSLTQDNPSVADYEAKFTELERFVPDQVDTDEKRANRFQQGLKSWI